MAISLNTLTGSVDTTNRGNGNPYTTASVTITANRLALLAVKGRATTNIVLNDPAIAGTLSATWALIAAVNIPDTQAGRSKVWLYRTMVGTNQTGTITIDPATSQTWTHGLWSLVEYDGVDTTGTNGSGAVVQSQTAVRATAGTSLEITLSAFGAADNRPYGAFGDFFNGDDDYTPGNNFAEIHDLFSETDGLFTEWAETVADTTVDASWTTSEDSVGGVAIEIKAAAAAPTGPGVGSLMLLGTGR